MPEIFKWAVLWSLVIVLVFVLKAEQDTNGEAIAVELNDGSLWKCERSLQ